jgi:ATP-binding cassette subfamily C protein
MVACESAFWSLQQTIDRSTAQAETLSGSLPARLAREVTLRHVSFAYGERPVLRDASLRIPVGELTLLVGASGAGKTSILDLVIGLVRPQSGEVWIDDLPLSEVDLKSWRTIIGYVAQETFLLHESILVNVTLGDKTVTSEAVEQALRDAGIWEFVSALPNGMSTPVGERGSGISGGQRQRIAIARALVRRPQLLILDEATASLDPESEAAVCATVQRLRGRVTLLAISHQAALLDAADRAYRLENGAVHLIRERGAAGQSVNFA